MRTNLDTDPAVIGIASATSLDRFSVVGRLHRLWSWADMHSVDGHAMNVTETFLDELAAAPGFSKAMRKVGWLEGRDGALTFPRFDRHNGQTAKSRGLATERKSRERHAASVTETRPEKRREDTKNGGGSAHEAAELPLGDEPALDQVRGWASLSGVTPEEAEAYFNARMATGWMVNGTRRKPGAHDLKSWVGSYRQNNADRAPKPGAPRRGAPLTQSGDYTL